MATRAERGWRALGAGLLLVLLLVPAVLRGHRHADHTAASRPCAVCLATAYTPTLGSPALADVAPHMVGVHPAPARALPPGRLERPAHGGRAPPPLPVGLVA